MEDDITIKTALYINMSTTTSLVKVEGFAKLNISDLSFYHCSVLHPTSPTWAIAIAPRGNSVLSLSRICGVHMSCFFIRYFSTLDFESSIDFITTYRCSGGNSVHMRNTMVFIGGTSTINNVNSTHNNMIRRTNSYAPCIYFSASQARSSSCSYCNFACNQAAYGTVCAGDIYDVDENDLSHCNLIDNTISNPDAGLICTSYSPLTITKCVFLRNTQITFRQIGVSSTITFKFDECSFDSEPSVITTKTQIIAFNYEPHERSLMFVRNCFGLDITMRKKSYSPRIITSMILLSCQ